MDHPRTSSIATISSNTDNTTTVSSIASMMNQTDNSPNQTAPASNNTPNSSSINISRSSISNTNNNANRRSIDSNDNSNIYKTYDNNTSNTNILTSEPFHPMELQTNNSTGTNMNLDSNTIIKFDTSHQQNNKPLSTNFPLHSEKTKNDASILHNIENNFSSDLFKNYDPITGEFLGKKKRTNTPSGFIQNGTSVNNSSISTCAHQQDKLVPIATLLSTPIHPDPLSTKLPPTSDKIMLTAIPPALKILTTMKSRSYSVPTILHSSLKKLSNNHVIYTHSMSGNSHGPIKNNKVTKSIYNSGNASNTNNHEIINPGSWRRHYQQHQHHIITCQSNQHSNPNNNATLATNVVIPLVPHSKAPNSTSSSNINLKISSNSNSTAESSAQKIDTQEIINSNIPAVMSVQGTRTFDNKDSVSPNKIRRDNDESLILKDRINYFIQQQSLQLNVILPPINLQCLKEIDLQEIVKNPQLRHDIVFDPLLQFRPNLDGERGIKKRQAWDTYWYDVENELIIYMHQPNMFNYNHTRLVPLFDTLREILLTIVPQRESQQIENILDTELNVQNLVKSGNVWLAMNDLASWLAQLFKHHCAPMRDPWVDKMKCKFDNAKETQSMTELMDGFKSIFQILEAMKLDIANHQIRLLRPAILSNAVEFEKQYFNSLMEGISLREVNTNKNNINDDRKFLLRSSLMWFKDKFSEYLPTLKNNNMNAKAIIPQVYRIYIKSIISLLSCNKMVREYPTSLSFDHARLILLRADIRQLVCLLVCRLHFQQLVASDKNIDPPVKKYILTNYDNNKLQNEIISIITDEHGNCRWTKNTLSIAIHLCKVIKDLTLEYNAHNKDKSGNLATRNDIDESGNTSINESSMLLSKKVPILDNQKISFSKSWLSKQTQPLSEIYSVLEKRVFSLLEETIFNNAECTMDGRVNQEFVYSYNPVSSTISSNNNKEFSTMERVINQGETSNNKLTSFRTLKKNFKTKTSNNIMAIADMEQFENIYRHLNTIINFHWSVFNSHYIDMVSESVQTI